LRRVRQHTDCDDTRRARREYRQRVQHRTLIPVAANQRNNMDKASFVFCTALREHGLENTEDDE